MPSDGRTNEIMDDGHAEKVDRVVTSLMELFADRALEVSERQISMGDIPSVAEIWREIADAIRSRSASR